MSEDTWRSFPSVGKVALIACAGVDHADRLKAWFTRAGWIWVFAEERESVVRALASRSFDIIVTDEDLGVSDVQILLKNMETLGSTPPCLLVGPSRSENDVDAMWVRIGEPQEILETELEEFIQREIYGSSMFGDAASVSYPLIVEQSFTAAQVLPQRPPLSLLEALCHWGRIDSATRLRLELAYQEALANSVEHGNLELLSEWKEHFDAEGRDRYALVRDERVKLEPYSSRKVRVIAECAERELTIRIIDDGPGFSLDAVRAVPRTELQLSGRGLDIIDEVMDEVTFENGGREIIMKKILA